MDCARLLMIVVPWSLLLIQTLNAMKMQNGMENGKKMKSVNCKISCKNIPSVKLRLMHIQHKFLISGLIPNNFSLVSLGWRWCVCVPWCATVLYPPFTLQAVHPAARSFSWRQNHPQVALFRPSFSHYKQMATDLTRFFNHRYTPHHIGYHSKKFIRACIKSSAHAHGTKIRGRKLKHFKPSKGHAR